VGGLPYLAHARVAVPTSRFVYVADRENFPYGEKDTAQIVAAALSVTSRLIRTESPRIIVVACNTISVVALGALRAEFPVPFVGVVPAVKAAAALSISRRVGVLATRQTVEGEYLRQLVQDHASGCTVVSLTASDLVDFVERRMQSSTPEEREARVEAVVERFRGAGIDALVLGCTHFLHLEPEFSRSLARERIALVDSRDGVSRQLARLMTSRNPPEAAPARGSLYVTGEGAEHARYRWFAERFALDFGGSL
jgi:glutamate racemase